MIKKRFSVSIFCGPTATGKTQAAVDFAKKNGGEIINCDLSQIYSVGKIATAQITEKDMCGIPHHLIGFLDSPLKINAYYMRELIERKILEIFLSRGDVPIVIVGGSLFCVYSLFFAPLDFYVKLKKFYDTFLYLDFPSSLCSFDCFSLTKKTVKSDIFFGPLFEYKIFHFDLNSIDYWRDIVKERFLSFICMGLLDEINSMGNEWREFLYLKKTIGYYEIISYMKKKSLCSISNSLLSEDLINEVYHRTCQYGKRQRTYGRKLFRDTSFFSVENNYCVL